jgi:hypothetical protein
VRAPLAIAGGPATWKLGTNVKAQQKLNTKGLEKTYTYCDAAVSKY